MRLDGAGVAAGAFAALLTALPIGLVALGAPPAMALLLTAPPAGLAGWATVRSLRRRFFIPLTEATGALARRERYVRIPGMRAPDALGELARAIAELRGVIAEADALAEERKAEHEERENERTAREMFINRFGRHTRELFVAMGEAAKSLHGTAAKLIDMAGNARQGIATSAEVVECISDSVVTMGQSTARVKTVMEDIDRRIGRADGAAAEGVSDGMAGALSEVSRQVNEITDLIEEIARETKLMALTATIEARRAWQDGNGFAAAAAQLRTVSRDTTQATAGVGSQVDRLAGAVDEAVGALNQIATTPGDQPRRAPGVSVTPGGAAPPVAVLTPKPPSAAADAVAERTRTTALRMMDAAAALNRQFAALERDLGGFFGDLRGDGRGGAIRIGVLHSLSGTMGASEHVLKDLLVLLVQDLNRAGGLLGRPVETVILNPRSDWRQYGAMAERLLADDKVSAIFGCWTSISRNEVRPVVEKHDGLLFYPVQYEGEEPSPNVFYTGATPNQQALPAIDFLMRGRGGSFERFFLVGTDYVYPQVANRILVNYLASKGITDVPVRLTPFAHEDWEPIVSEIRRFTRDERAAVVSTINGDANVHFYRELARQGVKAFDTPVMAFSIGENDVAEMDAKLLNGHLVACNYLMALGGDGNRRFVERWRRHTGNPKAATDDPMEAAWIAFHLWCDAVRAAGTPDPAAVRAALGGLSVHAPGGSEVRMDPNNHHLHKPVVIGRFNRTGGIDVVFRSAQLTEPVPRSPYL